MVQLTLTSEGWTPFLDSRLRYDKDIDLVLIANSERIYLAKTWRDARVIAKALHLLNDADLAAVRKGIVEGLSLGEARTIHSLRKDH